MTAVTQVAALAAPLLMIGTTASAQTVAFETLRPPSAPALVLLGIEPASVQKPESPRALTTTLLSLLGDKEGIPKSVAFEVTPFWLRSRASFSYNDFFANGKGFLRTVLITTRRSTALSLATTPRLVGVDTVGTSVALGARALLWPGRPAPILEDLRSRASARFAECAGLDTLEAIDKCQRAFTDSIRLNSEPVGLVVQLALGMSGEFPGDTIEEGRVRRLGVWLSPSYRLPQNLELIFVARLLRDRDTPSATKRNLRDVGGRVRWKPNAFLAISGEALQRVDSEGVGSGKTSTRFAALTEYKVSDDIYLFHAFGKDFEMANAQRSRLLSTLGIHLGVGPEPMVNLK